MGIFNAAIFNNAVFNTADTGIVLLGGTPAGPNVNPNAANFFYELPYEAYKREQKLISEHQDAVIALKLEAQANIVRQRDLQAQRDKQSLRQLKALEREQVALSVAVAKAQEELVKWQQIHNNNMAIIILMAAYPYLNIQGGTMH